MSETNGQMWRRMGIRIVTERKETPQKRKKTVRDYPAALLDQIRVSGLPLPVREYAFHNERKWRLDLAWPEQKIGVECHGGVFAQGRHTRGKGFTSDREKMNEAANLGWRIIEATPEHIQSGLALAWVRQALEGR